MRTVDESPGGYMSDYWHGAIAGVWLIAGVLVFAYWRLRK